MKNLQIDLSVPPFCPQEWKSEEYRPLPMAGSVFIWNKALQASALHPCSSNQNGCQLMYGIHEKRLPVLNAVILDALLENESQIPEEWGDGKRIFFPATRYQNPEGKTFLRCLLRFKDCWKFYYHRIDNKFPENAFLAIQG